MAAHTLRIMYFVGSFHYIQYKGVCAKKKDAPILCIAPHSSFFDSILAMVLGAPAVVAKAETASIPFFGSRFYINISFVTIFIFNYYYYYFNYLFCS